MKISNVNRKNYLLYYMLTLLKSSKLLLLIKLYLLKINLINSTLYTKIKPDSKHSWSQKKHIKINNIM